jgi:hypothetical protein
LCKVDVHARKSIEEKEIEGQGREYMISIIGMERLHIM